MHQVLNLPTTPDSELIKKAQIGIGTLKDPDQGYTMVQKRAGIPLSAGIIKSIPFPRTNCHVTTDTQSA